MHVRVVVAPDSFKGSMTAVEAADAIARGFLRVFPDAIVDRVPIADGGEGTVQALVGATRGSIERVEVTNPLGDRIEAEFGLLGGGATAVVEMASASGLTLIAGERRNPLLTTTYGTGDLIKAALDRGVTKLIVGIGGSATNDGGAGMAQALGARLLDSRGEELAFGGADLNRLQAIDVTGLDQRLEGVEVVVACDVTNPLTGPDGASAVYGPQKGASPEMISTLDAALAHYAAVLERDLGVCVENTPGAGAAGGLGAGLIAFTGARLLPGIELVLDVVGLASRVAETDLVITGEGAIDHQTSYGKAPAGVAKVARAAGVPVVALAGRVGTDAVLTIDCGIDAFTSIVPGPIDLSTAIAEGPALLIDASERMARFIAVGLRLGSNR